MSTEADDDEMEEVEFVSVSHMFQKFIMHYIKKLPVCTFPWLDCASDTLLVFFRRLPQNWNALI